MTAHDPWGARRIRAVAIALLLATASCTGAPQPATGPAAVELDEALAHLPAEPALQYPAPSASPTPSEPSPTPTDASPSPTPTPTPTPAPPLRIAFVGDVHGEHPIAAVLREGSNPLDGMASVLGEADIAIANLETAVGSSGAAADKSFTFRASPALLDALAAAGIDVVSLANNHALDYGVGALAETIALAGDAGLLVVGAGQDAAEAYAPLILDSAGRSVAIVGLTRVMPEAHWAAGASSPGMASAYTVETAADAVRAAAEQADHVVVMIHWGQERNPCPVDHQLVLAEALTAAGAQVVAGHHPHVLQGIELRGAALVAYSLGNFVFYARTGEGRTTGVLTVTLDDGGVSDWAFSPAQIDDRGRPQPLAGDAADSVLALLADRSPGGRCRF